MYKKMFLLTLLILIFSLIFTACKEEELGPSIFDTNILEVDPELSTYSFDLFLQTHYRKPYNIRYIYKLEDSGTQQQYNFVPAELQYSKNMAVLLKYIFLDTFKENIYYENFDEDFLKKHAPRQILLHGNLARNRANSALIRGSTEAGVKISLFDLNTLNVNNNSDLKERYILNLYHYYSLILLQKEAYPLEFNLISSAYYEPSNWATVFASRENARMMGFVRDVAAQDPRNDFAATLAEYLISSDGQWEELLIQAGWRANGQHVLNAEGFCGGESILLKLSIVHDWLQFIWNIDLNKWRNQVQMRIADINHGFIEDLLNEYEID